MKNKKRELSRLRRRKRVRKRIFGSSIRARLCVRRSLKNLYVQIIDDSIKHTLVCASTLDKEFKKQLNYGGNAKAASLLGEILAQRTTSKGITQVAFDRGSYLYHGRIKAFAEAARKAGLVF